MRLAVGRVGDTSFIVEDRIVIIDPRSQEIQRDRDDDFMYPSPPYTSHRYKDTRSRSRNRPFETDDEPILGFQLPRRHDGEIIPRAYLASVPHLLSQQ